MFCQCRTLKTAILALIGSVAGIWGSSYILQPKKSCQAEFFDVLPGQRQASYLYAPGLMATEMAMGRYCPQFTAITGEQFTFKKGGHVIGQPHTAVIFPEIDLRKPGYFTLNPITAYINSIRQDLFPLISRLFQQSYDFDVIENPDSTLSVMNYSINFGQANAAQTKDIKAIHKTYHEHCATYPDTDVVLFGDSRGATALFNFLAEYRHLRIKAAILESAYDSMDHYIKHLICLDKEQCAADRIHSLFGLLAGSYKKNGPTARKYAEIITDEVPLLLVASLKDSLVNPHCVFYLYNRLRERGFTNVHVLVLKYSSHPCYMLDNADDKQLYENVVHAFYKQYDLPHNAAKARAGKAAFAATQPTHQELEQLYNLPSCQKCWQPQK